jgi:predicted nucleic acid-binding protein
LSAYFLDSSAVVKRYVAEAGTAWVSELCAPSSGNELYAAAGVEGVAGNRNAHA